MCGIVGEVSWGSRISLEQFRKSVTSLRHRGPDDSGVWSDEECALGHTRLAILDLSKRASQPMRDPSGRFSLVFNGEIYNYQALRESLRAHGHSFTSTGDSEVLLAAFAQWGTACLERLDGMFAFGVWDAQEHELTLARDRSGEKPLLYSWDRHGVVFSSELRGLLPLFNKAPTLNAMSIRRYFQFQYIPEPDTAFEGVFKLPPGHFLSISRKSLGQDPVPYWSLSLAGENVDVSKDRKQAVNQVRNALEAAVVSTLEADVPIAVALSGGIDSSAIAAIASSKYGRHLRAYAVGYPERPPYDERDQAHSFAKSLGIQYTEIEIQTSRFTDDFVDFVRSMNDPIADPAAYAHMAVPRALAADGTKVLLSGLGGDELFWGYSWVVRAKQANERKARDRMLGNLATTARSLRARRSPAGGFKDLIRLSQVAPAHFRANWTPRGGYIFFEEGPEFAEDLLAFRLLGGSKIRATPKKALMLPSHPWPGEVTDVQSPSVRVLQSLFKTWLASNALALGDSVSMAFGVETRMPFLEPNLIGTALAVQSAFPDFSDGHKTLLREALTQVLPSEILSRPKAGFRPPVQEWLGGVVRTYIQCLFGGMLDRSDLIDVRSILQLHEGDEALPPWSQLFLLYKMVLLEMWLSSIYAQWEESRA